MKRLIIVLAILLIVSPAGFSAEPQPAPLNPDFVEYLNKSISKSLQMDVSGYGSLGYIPLPVRDNMPNKMVTNKSKAPLPPRYDLRDSGYVTSVKFQGDSSSCWAFSSLASIESWWLRAGRGNYDLSENNMKNCHGFSSGPYGGGNSLMAAAYLTRLSGPVSETTDPFQDNDHSCRSESGPVLKYITDYRLLFLDNDPELIKEIIYNNGAVYSNMYWQDSSYNESNHTYYSSASNVMQNHTVTIVGWDDNRETTGGTGAWIAKNSWGTDWGENGYFYISYHDPLVLEEVAFWPESINHDPDMRLYMYDRLGAVGGYGWKEDSRYDSHVSYALIKYTAEFDLVIKKIGFWVEGSEINVDIDIYRNFDGTNLYGALWSLRDPAFCEYRGYYTRDLDTPVVVGQGKNFYIKVRYAAPVGREFVIPTEWADGGYAAPVIEKGKCWTSLQGDKWWPVGNDIAGHEVDLCIRAYTTPPENARSSVETGDVDNIKTTTAVASATITTIGTSGIDQHGFCWSTEENPTTSDRISSEGAIDTNGTYTSNITGLYAGRDYYYRAYVTGSAGTSYGEEKMFTTLTIAETEKESSGSDSTRGCFIQSTVHE